MNRNRPEPAARVADNVPESALDRILAGEEELVPTSGFLAAVMERVEDEAAAPAPLPFPWKRILPGMVLMVGLLAWGVFALAGSLRAALNTWTLTAPYFAPSYLPSLEAAAGVAGALTASLLGWLFSRRLAGRGGLL
jgi:hypothetical protein